jgi:sodium/potassium-transporting ATPase subunit alpha
MKGAPEVILGKCSTFASSQGVGSQQAEMTDQFRKEFMETYEKFASKGRRVLALCSRAFKSPKDIIFSSDGNTFNFPTTDLNFVALVAIMDPPRDNVPEAIKKCHCAGVKVFMVTGDHPLTAKSIAQDVGLLSSDNNIELFENKTTEKDWESCQGALVHGSRINALTEQEWRTILAKDGVCFARTTPAHKLLIVQKCQTLMGHIVAVTGDGVNDAPALKQADVGVAMGLNGSAVAQESADILLMDDNFASIVAAIEEGRIIFDNIKKTITYTMVRSFSVDETVLAVVFV